jgi:hypothetical protein
MSYKYHFDMDIENENVTIFYSIDEDTELTLLDVRDCTNSPIETTIFSEDYFARKAWDNYLNYILVIRNHLNINYLKIMMV